MSASTVNVSSHFIPPLNSSSPALAFQVTSLVDSYMIWAGIMEGHAEDVHNAASHGRLTQEWACAMPSLKASSPSPATSLFRTSSADVALPMAQRLARRFKKQIFLSLDLPPAFMTMGEGMRLTLEVEKRAVEILKKLEAPQAP
ncbi:hypothetical protein JB92DRAFT_2901589 [Gautieria morchelliformis]|nr:hypothetical protein JB92DRAFT_2901589 [Gautieria morchelliformis]